uniref:Putative secreted protein n=1 Tax=Anopheles darlingi TaxID=43151 RepID=A0A2M4DC60_ANODA
MSRYAAWRGPYPTFLMGAVLHPTSGILVEIGSGSRSFFLFHKPPNFGKECEDHEPKNGNNRKPRRCLFPPKARLVHRSQGTCRHAGPPSRFNQVERNRRTGMTELLGLLAGYTDSM